MLLRRGATRRNWARSDLPRLSGSLRSLSARLDLRFNGTPLLAELDNVGVRQHRQYCAAAASRVLSGLSDTALRFR